GDHGGEDEATTVRALLDGVQAVHRVGGATPGDKTMIDAALPFAAALDCEWKTPGDLATATSAAAVAAKTAAEETSGLTARLGRSRALGEKSRGTPDPGATSFAVLMETLVEHFRDKK